MNGNIKVRICTSFHLDPHDLNPDLWFCIYSYVHAAILSRWPFLAYQKIRDRFLAHPDKSMTLEDLVNNEKGEKKRVATEGLMWLLR